MDQTVEISSEMIRLGQLLKLAGVASNGADARALVAAGRVTSTASVSCGVAAGSSG